MIRDQETIRRLGWFLNANVFDVPTRMAYADMVATEQNKFRRDGYQPLAQFQRDEALEMAERFKDKPTTPEGTLDHFALDDILEQPEFKALVTSQVVMNAVAMWLGAAPKVLMMSLWRSHVNPGAPEGAQEWHRDMDDWRTAKLFLYLTDVTTDTGPHMLMPGTHRPELFEAAGLPPDRYFVAASREERFHAELDEWPRVEFTGPAGSCWLENTYCFHRGKVPAKGERMVFQALYGLNDFSVKKEDYEKIQGALYPPT